MSRNSSLTFMSIRLASVLVCLSSFGLGSQALALPSGRVYEQVSPVFKGGYGVRVIEGVDPSGENVLYASSGAFAGQPSDPVSNAYETSRSAVGWFTSPLDPPPSLSPKPLLLGVAQSLESLWMLTLDASSVGRAEESHKQQLWVEGPAGLRPNGPVVESVDVKPFASTAEGSSLDFCHVVIGEVGALLLQAAGARNQFYDVSAGCNGEDPTVSLIMLNNNDGLLSPLCRGVSGRESGGGAAFNVVSADGSEVFFGLAPPGLPGCGDPPQLFVRVSGTRTLEISRPLDPSLPFGGCGGGGKPGEVPGEVPCDNTASRPAASFQGASEDGSTVYFTTSARLDQSTDVDSNSDLYMAKIGCRSSVPGCSASEREVLSLTQVSRDTTSGQAAEVQGVTRVAPDGSHIYFLARGVLSAEGPNREGVQALPVRGAENLYVYDSVTGATKFIGDVCSASGVSGTISTVRCPPDLGNEGTTGDTSPNRGLLSPSPLAQTIGKGGEMLIFTSYARLIAAGPEADIDNAQDVYRYDARTGELQRVSVGEGGANNNGNGADVEKVGEFPLENADAQIQPLAVNGAALQEEHRLARQAANEDGSRIVFSSSAPLSPRASNGLPDIYEWHNGVVSLISTGSSVEADERPVITPAGNDIFFASSQGLVGQDRDGIPDIYDARIGGGFPEPAAEPRPCSGDACQGPLTNPAPLLVPGSVSQVSGENLASPKKAKTVKRSKKKRKRTRPVAKGKKTEHGARARHAGAAKREGPR